MQRMHRMVYGVRQRRIWNLQRPESKMMEFGDVIFGDIAGVLVILQVQSFHSTMKMARMSGKILYLLCILLFAIAPSIAKSDQDKSQGIMSQNPLNGTIQSDTDNGDIKLIYHSIQAASAPLLQVTHDWLL
jgi:hypothetical protein